jgi:hypothetical protein
VAKFHDFPTHLTIDQASVIHGVVIVHNEKGMFQLRGALACWYQPHKVLLDSSVQPLILGKVIVDGLRLIDVNFDPCPHQILTSMGGSK